MNTPPEDLKKFQSLVEVMTILRGPTGCPWDREQDHTSLTRYALEEAAELVEAIESGEDKDIVEELGDLLLQIVFHAEMGRQRGSFDISDVVESINSKMVRRHPHVFSDTTVSGSGEVLKNWDEIKKSEKPNRVESMGGPPHLPALQRAYNIGKKTKKQGFDWERAEQVISKLEEEIAELREAIQKKGSEEIETELGDLLFSAAQISRHLGFEPEQTLRKGNRKFEARFQATKELAKQAETPWETLSEQEKENLWERAKNRE